MHPPPIAPSVAGAMILREFFTIDHPLAQILFKMTNPFTFTFFPAGIDSPVDEFDEEKELTDLDLELLIFVKVGVELLLNEKKRMCDYFCKIWLIFSILNNAFVCPASLAKV